MRSILSLVWTAAAVFFTRRDYSFGVIPVLEQKEKRLYLLICSKKGYWGFPKGHALLSESPLDAAKRELREEAGILNCDLISNFPIEQSYYFKQFWLKIYKTTRLYIGKVNSSKVVMDNNEITTFKWLDFNQALKTVSLEYGGEALIQAERYLNGR